MHRGLREGWGDTRKSSAMQFDLMSHVGETWRTQTCTQRPILSIRLKGAQGPFRGASAKIPDVTLYTAACGGLRGSRGIFRHAVWPYVTCGRDLTHANVHPEAHFDQKAQRCPRSIQGRVSIGSRCNLMNRGLRGLRGSQGIPPPCSLTLSHMWARADARNRAPGGQFWP